MFLKSKILPVLLSVFVLITTCSAVTYDPNVTENQANTAIAAAQTAKTDAEGWKDLYEIKYTSVTQGIVDVEVRLQDYIADVGQNGQSVAELRAKIDEAVVLKNTSRTYADFAQINFDVANDNLGEAVIGMISINLELANNLGIIDMNDNPYLIPRREAEAAISGFALASAKWQMGHRLLVKADARVNTVSNILTALGY